jgi:trafficking protein particle complex subunit 12
MGFYELGREAREEAVRAKSDADKTVWTVRLRELGIRVANILVEMGDLEGAATHLSTLKATGRNSEEEVRLNGMEALVWLKTGDVAAAKRCLALPSQVEADAQEETSQNDSSSQNEVLKALLQMADSDYTAAISSWESILSEPPDPMVSQNLAVCLLYTGRIAAVSIQKTIPSRAAH